MRHLDREAGHAIHASVPRRDDSNSLALLSMFDGGLDTFLLAGHPCGDADLASCQISDGLQIGRIACDDAARLYGLLGTWSAIKAMARTDPDYKELSRAMATVTPFRLIRF